MMLIMVIVLVNVGKIFVFYLFLVIILSIECNLELAAGDANIRISCEQTFKLAIPLCSWFNIGWVLPGRWVC